MENRKVQDDRRVHTVFVTRNTEYHLRKCICIAVRDRRTGEWLEDHGAVNQNLAGALHYTENGVTIVRTPGPGDALCFEDPEILTSRVIAVERPPKDVVSAYGA